MSHDVTPFGDRAWASIISNADCTIPAFADAMSVVRFCPYESVLNAIVKSVQILGRCGRMGVCVLDAGAKQTIWTSFQNFWERASEENVWTHANVISEPPAAA